MKWFDRITEISEGTRPLYYNLIKGIVLVVIHCKKVNKHVSQNIYYSLD